MSIDALLAHLKAVKRVGSNRWQARCPAHDDRNPSLSIKDDSGCVLVKCWGGCDTGDVLAAVGLKFDDLFPERPTHHRRPDRRPFPAIDVLRAIVSDVLVVAVAGSHLGNGGAVNEHDRAELIAAAARILAAAEESGYA